MNSRAEGDYFILKFEENASILVSGAILSLQRLQIVDSVGLRNLFKSTITLQNGSLELYVRLNVLLMSNYLSRKYC